MKPKRRGLFSGLDYSFCNVTDCFLKKKCKRHMSNYVWTGEEVYFSLIAPAHNRYTCDMFWRI
jgi:hypothetical protein